jgi:DNA-binding transcriptional MerR regulator
MRVTEAARDLGISSDWLRRLERAGTIPLAPRDLHGHRRYTPELVAVIRERLYPDSGPAALPRRRAPTVARREE